MKLLKNHWALIGFALTVLLDSQYHLLESFISDPKYIMLAKALGAVLLAYFTKENLGIIKPKNQSNTQSLDDEIGGGGIHNPRP